MAWITDTQLKEAVAGALGLASAHDLPSHWDQVVEWANRDAYKRIRSALMGRGFTDDQLDEWEARTEWNERVGICTAIKRAAMRGEQYDTQSAIEDCKAAFEELKTETIVIDGEAIYPTGGLGRVGYGEYASDPDDRHTLDDVL
jgi:hypothetical protein